MECTTGVRIAPRGARWTWNTLADSACSHHIPSLAPAVALPAPRHDRRRTGAAGSPPGGFPFVELTSRGCEMCGGARRRVSRYWRRTKLRSFPRKRESTTSCPGRAKRDPGPRDLICGPGSPQRGPRDASVAGCPSRGRAEEGISRHTSTGALLDSGNSLCYRTQPLRGHRGGRFGRIAQLVEQLTLNQRVPGSSPGAPTKKLGIYSIFDRLTQMSFDNVLDNVGPGRL